MDTSSAALALSQRRWRGDEPNPGLTWGVEISGDAFVDVMAAHIDFAPQSTLVEIGPGYGRIIESLLRYRLPFFRYIGLEISSARVDRLRERFRDPRMTFYGADILCPLEFPIRADIIFGAAVFEHFYPDFSGALATINGIHKPGGSLVFDVIREPDESTSIFENDVAFVRWYTQDEIQSLLAKAGYQMRTRTEISFGRARAGYEILRSVYVATKGMPIHGGLAAAPD
jgi:SAM-dependent methyltransferase